MDQRTATRITRWKLTQAVKIASTGDDGSGDRWAKIAKEKQRKIRCAWNTLAVAFEKAGQPELAQQIRRFVDTMSPAQTEREHLIAQARKLLDKQQIDKHQMRDCGRSR